MRSPFFAVVASLVLIGCSREEPSPDRPAPAAVARADPADVAKVVAGNNRFAWDLHAHLRDEPGNLFFSPYSVSTALAMTYAGARNATADEMAKTLHLGLDPKRLHPAFAKLQSDLRQDPAKSGMELHVANALWGQKNYGFRPDFLQLTKTHYGAGLQEVDFLERDVALARINGWAKSQTRDKIPTLLQPDDIKPLTRLVLTNAIYMKGQWQHRFNKKHSTAQAFYRSPKDPVQVLTMSQTDSFPYLETKTFQALSMLYSAGNFATTIFLPAPDASLADFEKDLSADKVAAWVGKMSTTRVNLYLPRFKLTHELRLKELLTAMGMPLAFDRENADFSGINDASGDPERKLFISNVIHKASLEVNEEGSEAAAATGVVLEKKDAADAKPPVVPTFRVNRPFVFVIHDVSAGTTLFIGRVHDPGK
jgi:leukocyte elastase inhibitor